MELRVRPRRAGGRAGVREAQAWASIQDPSPLPSTAHRQSIRSSLSAALRLGQARGWQGQWVKCWLRCQELGKSQERETQG